MSETHTESARRPLPHPAVAPIEGLRLFRVSGPGTDKFLQGQLSQHLEHVTAGRSHRAAASTPKGRAYLLTRLVRDGDDILLSVPAELVEPAVGQLNKYLMLFRGTTMTKLTQAAMFGLLGTESACALYPEAAQDLSAAGDTVPLGSGHLIRTEDTAEGLPRFELWLPEGPDDTLAGQLAKLPRASAADWQAAEIAAGIATLDTASSQGYVPQMLNWQHLDGVHFNKGCYTGQEVIARMHFLGQLKKSLFRLRTTTTDRVPATGTPVYAGERRAGETVRAVGFEDGSVELLAVLRHDAVATDVRLGAADGPVLEWLPLPYPVPEREQSRSA